MCSGTSMYKFKELVGVWGIGSLQTDASARIDQTKQSAEYGNLSVKSSPHRK